MQVFILLCTDALSASFFLLLFSISFFPLCLRWSGVDLTSDDALAHMTFAGFAGQRLTVLSESSQAADPDGAVYVCDFSELLALEVCASFVIFFVLFHFSDFHIYVIFDAGALL